MPSRIRANTSSCINSRKDTISYSNPATLAGRAKPHIIGIFPSAKRIGDDRNYTTSAALHYRLLPHPWRWPSGRCDLYLTHHTCSRRLRCKPLLFTCPNRLSPGTVDCHPPIRVNQIHRVVQAVCKHVKSQVPLPRADILIRVDESADEEAVVPCLQVVEASAQTEEIPTVPQGVDVRYMSTTPQNLSCRSGHLQQVAPGVVQILCHDYAIRGPADLLHISL